MPVPSSVARRGARASTNVRGRAEARPGAIWARRLPKALVLAFAITFGSQPVAEAHVVYEEPTVYNANNGDQCLKVRGEVNHGDYGHGGTRSGSYSRTKLFGFWDCGTSKWKPAGQIATTWDYWYNPVAPSTPGLCQEDAYWWVNGSEYWYVEIEDNFVYPPCGAGEYGTYGFGQVYYQGAWRGPWAVWSGWHQFYDSGGK